MRMYLNLAIAFLIGVCATFQLVKYLKPPRPVILVMPATAYIPDETIIALANHEFKPGECIVSNRDEYDGKLFWKYQISACEYGNDFREAQYRTVKRYP